MGRSRVSPKKMGKNSQMKIKRKKITSIIMSNQNIFIDTREGINSKKRSTVVIPHVCNNIGVF